MRFFVQGIKMMRKIQEESFANAQRMVEKSTHQVMKEIMFDNDHDLNVQHSKFGG